MNKILSTPQSWQVKSLGDLSALIQYGYTAKAQGAKVGPKFLRITDIQDNSVKWQDVPFCFIDDREKVKYLLDEGDLLFARTGATVGKSFLIKGVIPESVFASYLIRVRLQQSVDPKYIAYFFKSPDYWSQISESQSGIGQPNVNGTKLAQIQIPVAPLPQQKRIVAEIEKQFSRLDEAIANLKRVKANLKRYKAAVLKTAVEGTLLNSNQQSRDWPITTLGNLAHAAGYGTSVKCSYNNTGVVVLRIPNIADGRIDFSDLKRAPESYSTDEEDYLAPGDLLMIRTNGSKNLIGRGAVVTPPVLFPQTFASYLIRFRLKDNPTLWRWIVLVLNYSGTRQWIEQHAASSAGQHNVSLSLLKSMPVPLPTEEEQECIAAEVERRFSIMQEVEEAVEVNLKRVERFRQSILQQVFAGV